MTRGGWALAALLFAGGAGAREIPKPLGRVSDFAGVLNAEERSALEAVAAELERRSTAELAVVVEASLEGETVEGRALALFNAWGVGKKGKDNGVLILLAVADRRVRLEVGYGLEPRLPDGLCGEIIRRDMTPAFRSGRLGAGLLAGAKAVARAASGESPEPARLQDRSWYPWLFGFVVVLFFGALGYVFVLYSVLNAGAAFSGALVSGLAALGLRYLLAGADRPVAQALWGGSLGGGGRWTGGGGFGGGGGGFGGGSSGGGGASGSW